MERVTKAKVSWRKENSIAQAPGIEGVYGFSTRYKCVLLLKINWSPTTAGDAMKPSPSVVLATRLYFGPGFNVNTVPSVLKKYT